MANPPISDYQLNAELLEALTEIQQFVEIDSTNLEAIRLLDAGSTGNILLLAHSQSDGRGRRGKSWHSPPGAGIYMSLVRPFAVSTQALQALSLVTALSVHEALAECGIVGIQLKWPNDLLVNRKKLAGILLELKTRKNQHHVVFGIGINLKLPAAALAEIAQPATDIASISPHPVNKSVLVNTVLTVLMKNIQEFERSAFNSFYTRWNALDYYLNQDIVLQVEQTQKIGKSLGVDDSGALLLQTAAGIETINGGEIFPSLRPAGHER